MNYYKLFEKRVEYNSRSNLKDRAFDRRLEKDYNKETIYLVNDMYLPIKAIIQTSRLQDKQDYKKISLPFTTKIQTGDVIYWERDNTNWLIYLQRNTEKNYFLGEMKEANYEITWKDDYGVKYSQLGCFIRNKGALSGDLLKHSHYLDYIDEDAQLLLTKTTVAKKLKLYDKFVIENTVWEVIGVDMTTYKNIIVYSLKSTEWNKDEDTEDLPYGKINIITKIESNLNYIDKIELNKEIVLNINTKLNGVITSDNYTVKVDNCSFDKNKIIFDKIGIATISIKSSKSEKVEEYSILVEEKTELKEEYFIIGSDNVKASLSYKFKIKSSLNDTTLLTTGQWQINNADNKDVATIEKVVENVCYVKMGKYSETFDLEYILPTGLIITKTINIKNIFDNLL